MILDIAAFVLAEPRSAGRFAMTPDTTASGAGRNIMRTNQGPVASKRVEASSIVQHFEHWRLRHPNGVTPMPSAIRFTTVALPGIYLAMCV